MQNKIICIINIIIITILFLGILNVFYFDKQKDNEHPRNNFSDNDSALIEQACNGNKLDYQINYLSQTIASSESLLDRKENSAWLAFALYISGIVFLFSIKPLNKIKQKGIHLCTKILVTLLLIIIALIAFAFIHAQYSSIYETYANNYAANILILKIIDSGEPIEDFQKEFKLQDDFALNHLVSKYRGKKHPVRIVFDFIFLDWAKSEERDLTNQNTQEASIYLIIILFNAIIISQIFIKNLFKT